MSLRLTRTVRRCGFLAALLALAVQLAATSIALPAAAPAAGLDRLVAASICHAGTAGDGPGTQGHHTPLCALCPLCQALAHAGALLAPPGYVLAPPAAQLARAGLPPPARAPPARRLATAYPRGPPALT